MFTFSDLTDKLIPAWVAANNELDNPNLDGSNPHFKSKYTKLDSMIPHVKAVYKKHGLSIAQHPAGDGNSIGMTTLVMHTDSGQWVQGEFIAPFTSDNPQHVGAALTYFRRFCMEAVAFIRGSEDDDAESVASQHKSRQAPRQSSAQVGGGSGGAAPTGHGGGFAKDLEGLQRQFFAVCREGGFDAAATKTQFVEQLGLDHFNDATEDQLKAAITRMREAIANV